MYGSSGDRKPKCNTNPFTHRKIIINVRDVSTIVFWPGIKTKKATGQRYVKHLLSNKSTKYFINSTCYIKRRWRKEADNQAWKEQQKILNQIDDQIHWWTKHYERIRITAHTAQNNGRGTTRKGGGIAAPLTKNFLSIWLVTAVTNSSKVINSQPNPRGCGNDGTDYTSGEKMND